MVKPDQTLALRSIRRKRASFSPREAQPLRQLAAAVPRSPSFIRTVILQRRRCRPHRRSHGAAHRHYTRDCVPDDKLDAFFENPFADVNATRTAPLKIDRAVISAVPAAPGDGWWPSPYTYSWRFLGGSAAYACGSRYRFHAHAHPNEHCPGHQPDGVDHARRDLPSGRQSKYGYSTNVVFIRWLHRDLLHYRGVFPAKPRASRLKKLKRTSKAQKQAMLEPPCVNKRVRPDCGRVI